MKKPLLSLIIISFTIIFFLGVYVGSYKIFPYEVLDSSKDVLFEQKTIQNNQFNQADVNSLIERTLHNYMLKANDLIGNYKRKKFQISVGDELPTGIVPNLFT